MKKEIDLALVRQRIDEIDETIQQLIVERANLVMEVGQIKTKTTDNPVFYRPEREAIILKNVMQRTCTPLAKEEMVKIFRTILSSCLALQRPLIISFLGPAGTFSESAVVKHFGHAAVLMPASSIHDVFANVQAKKADYGVVPIENSIGGIVNATMDEFIDTPLKICGEVNLPIHQNLLVHPAHDGKIDCIYSHEQSLLQCKAWLSQHYYGISQVAVSSSAYAAKLVSNNMRAAAIAGELAQEKYQLKMLAKHIEDAANNVTRFLIICHQSPAPSGDDRTSLIATITHKSGALEKLINPFSENNINLTLITSQPSRKESGNYLFFLDVDSHLESPAFKKMLEKLAANTLKVKILGSYPKAVM